jgi:hypothetical protein
MKLPGHRTIIVTASSSGVMVGSDEHTWIVGETHNGALIP